MRKVLFLLGNLSDRDVDWLGSIGRVRNVPAGEVLIRQGNPIQEIFLLLDGQLAVRVGAKAEVELARLYPGEIAGELSFLDSRPPNATVVAVEPSRILALGRLELNRKLGLDEAFAARFYRGLGVFLASRLRQRVGRMGFGAPDAPEAEDPDELDPELLDQTTLAAARFDQLLARFRQA